MGLSIRVRCRYGRSFAGARSIHDVAAGVVGDCGRGESDATQRRAVRAYAEGARPRRRSPLLSRLGLHAGRRLSECRAWACPRKSPFIMEVLRSIEALKRSRRVAPERAGLDLRHFVAGVAKTLRHSRYVRFGKLELLAYAAFRKLAVEMDLYLYNKVSDTYSDRS